MLNEKMENALNEQINEELYSSYLYLAMAAWFESQNLPGFASWMKVQAREENAHAMKFFAHIHDRGGRVTLQALDQYKPLVTYDNAAELEKIKRFAPHAGVVLRLRVANTGSQCELSSKFGCDPGEAVDLILAAFKLGLVVEGLSFHVGSQCTNFENFVQALNVAAAVIRESRERGHEIKILDIGGGFPAPYNRHVKPFSQLARRINAEIDRLFPRDIQILAEPGRFLVATAAASVARIIGKAVRDGRPCY